MCQVSTKVWPGTSPRHRLGPSYFTNLIVNEERGTPLPNIHSPSVSLFHLLKKSKSKNRTKYTLYKDWSGLKCSPLLGCVCLSPSGLSCSQDVPSGPLPF